MAQLDTGLELAMVRRLFEKLRVDKARGSLSRRDTFGLFSASYGQGAVSPRIEITRVSPE